MALVPDDANTRNMRHAAISTVAGRDRFVNQFEFETPLHWSYYTHSNKSSISSHVAANFLANPDSFALSTSRDQLNPVKRFLENYSTDGKPKLY